MIQNGCKITTNTKHIVRGDVFFCFHEAEKYLTADIFEKSDKIFCESGFINRVFLNSSIFPSELLDKYKDKIFETENLKKKLTESLQIEYPQSCNLIAITGTKGKTSTAWYVMQILGLCGIKCGYIGTIGVYFFDGNEIEKVNKDYTLTTPSADEIYRYIHELQQCGAETIVFEASSHALFQGRIDGLKIKCGCFTNLSQDHLDYHKTINAYFEAKSLLFSKYIDNDGICVINNDDTYGKKLIDICKKRNLLTKLVGVNDDKNAIKIKSINESGDFQMVVFKVGNEAFMFNTTILGQFQIYNLIEAVEICHCVGNISYQDVCNVIVNVNAPIGRMQRIDGTNIFIDFAHTPKSLEEGIKLLKSRYKKVAVVFGCGGDRDKKKRPIMCEIAAKMADFTIITSDNPRFENPSDIIKDIVCFIENRANDLKNDDFVKDEINKIDTMYNSKYCEYKVIEDRHEAIKFAVEKFLNNNEYVVMIAGKGHEDYQIIGDQKNHFSDFEEVKKNL